MPAFARQPELNRSGMEGELPSAMAAELPPSPVAKTASQGQSVCEERAEGLALDVVQIYEQHFDFAWRSLRRLGVAPADLEDAAQDVFVVVHRRLFEFEHRSAIKSWIFGIALRIAKIYRRKSARQRARVLVDEGLLVCTRDSPEQAREHVQAAEQVQLLLDDLDDDKRAVFILAELEQLPAADIAIALGIPANTVYSRLRLARAAFEAGLRRMRAKDEWRHR